MAIWVKVACGRFYSGDAGAEKVYTLEVLDWGLQIKDPFGALVVRAASSVNAKVRLHLDQGAVPDINALVTAGDPIAQTTLSSTSFPTTLKGTVSGPVLPYLRPALGVAGTSSQEWVEVEVFLGGRPF